MKTLKTTNDAEAVRAAVREGYARIAQNGNSCSGSGTSCCGSTAEDSAQLAKYVGYSAEELSALPEGANMGLSCGNPNALAALREGEVVLDLGSGGGFDAFIAGRKVGATGRAIGVDMTPEMLAKARTNISSYRQRSGLDNVEFRLGEIEHLPLPDNSVDVVISNCVLNLSPHKAQVWREIARVLKPRGRVAISDLALLRPLPEEILKMVEALIGCVAGAVLVTETERMARQAGLTDIKLNPKKDYVAVMTDWNDPLYKKIIERLPAGSAPGDYITSVEVTGRKAPSAIEYTPAVNELVAIGAAIAANCETCLKYHYRQADQLGVSKAHMARAVVTGTQVKDSPHQAILRLAVKLTDADLSQPVDASDRCCDSQEVPQPEAKAKCCG